MSQNLVDEFLDKGVFVKDQGTVGCKLDEFKLPYCMLRKSNGTGLYATKDLALAQIKFDQFKVDKSIYVVDSAQETHFRQVFATLQKMGYKQAEKCYHLSYGRIGLDAGGGAIKKMSSREGSVIYFSDVKRTLAERIDEVFGAKKAAEIDDAEWENVRHQVSIGTIKYGMLNHDVGKDVGFSTEKWCDAKGNCGPYLMMQCTRVKSINRKVPRPTGVKSDYSLLGKDVELQAMQHMSKFNNLVERATTEHNPSPLCDYLFDLAKLYSRWYDDKDNNVKHSKTDVLKVTRLDFCASIATILEKGLYLLGIGVVERM